MLDDAFILLRRLQLKIDLIPGPPHDNATLYNHAIQVIARYPGAEIASAFDRMPRVRTVVRRLPRLLTDQTATVTPVETHDVAEVMLESVRAMYAVTAAFKRRPTSKP